MARWVGRQCNHRLTAPDEWADGRVTVDAFRRNPPPMSTDSSKPIRSLRYPDRVIESLLDQLDAEPVDEDVNAKRAHKRFPHRVTAMPLQLEHPGSPTVANYLVSARNISAGGLSFLHGGFVHLGSRVQVQMISQEGMWTDLSGRVVQCRYIARGIHEVCIKFDQAIDPSRFCAAAATYDFLVVEDDDAIARLLQHHLSNLNVEVTRARNGREALQHVKGHVFDCVLMDMDMPIMNGWDAVKTMRDEGYAGRIVAVTAMQGLGDEQRCREAGCDDYVPKPIMPTTLRKILDSVNEEPIHSRFHLDHALRDVLADFCNGLAGEMQSLRKFQKAEDREGLARWARSMRGSAGSFGFDLLATAAQAVEAEAGGSDPEALGRAITEFIDVARRVEAPTEQLWKAG